MGPTFSTEPGGARITPRRAVAVGLCLAWASVVVAACAVPGFNVGDSGASVETGGDDGSGSDDGGDEDTGRSLLGCSIKNVGDIADCPGDCNAAIEGAEGVFQCTVTCDAVAQNCGDAYFCQIFQDGGTACLEDCKVAHLCSNSHDACDDVLGVCLPKSKTSGSSGDGDGPVEASTYCAVGIVEKTSDCDEDCDNPVYTGDGLYVCTTECDVEEQDCPGPLYRCEEVDDGTGACFLDCSSGHACPSDDYACDENLELCIPTR